MNSNKILEELQGAFDSKNRSNALRAFQKLDLFISLNPGMSRAISLMLSDFIYINKNISYTDGHYVFNKKFLAEIERISRKPR